MKSSLKPRFRTPASSAIALVVFFAIGVLSSCGQDYNSNSFDASIGPSGLDCSAPAGARLCAAYLAMQATQCFRCHGEWTAFKTDAAWTGSGLVNAGNPDGSLIITKLKNAGGNMPPDAGAMTAEQYQAMRDWVQNL